MLRSRLDRHPTGRALLGSAALAVIATVAVAGCSGGGDGSKASAAPRKETLAQKAKGARLATGPVTVAVEDNFFQPDVLRVPVGTSVTFANRGHNVHDVIPIDGGTFRVDTDQLRPGQTATVVLDRAGTFRYFCSIHGTAARGMRGIIQVEG